MMKNNSLFMYKPFIGIIILVLVIFLVGNSLRNKIMDNLIINNYEENYKVYIKDDGLIEFYLCREYLNDRSYFIIKDIIYVDDIAKDKYKDNSLINIYSIDSLVSKLIDIDKTNNTSSEIEIYTDYDGISSLIASNNDNKITYNKLNELDLSKIDNKIKDKIDS